MKLHLDVTKSQTINVFKTLESRFNEVHRNKYNYSLVEYKNTKKKITIICKEHGEFRQVPQTHLRGSGCPKCGGVYKPTTVEFIKKATSLHGNKYDYSKSVYNKTHKKITIICKKHGEFKQQPSRHLQGDGCPKCAGTYTPTTNEWVKRAIHIHGNRYIYTKVNYVMGLDKVIIICKEHGEFKQTPALHIQQGCGCPKCGLNKATTEKWIVKAKNIHGDKYDYSKTEYICYSDKITILCKEHGEFTQLPTNHLQGNGCPKCGTSILTTNKWVKKAREVHGNKYDYSKSIYIHNSKKVNIICPIHNEFKQEANSHLRGCGCPECSSGTSSDYNVLYLWLSDIKWDDLPVWKIGVTSERLNNNRIHQIANKQNLEVLKIYKWMITDALKIEKELHKLFDIIPNMDGDGYTEFRAVSHDDMQREIEWLDVLYS